jgi:hypothetical protein
MAPAAGAQQADTVTAEICVSAGKQKGGAKRRAVAWLRKVFKKHR